MKLDEIVIAERTWSEADPARQQEWRLSIHDILASDELSFPEEAQVLHVTPSEQTTILELRDAEGTAIASCEVPRHALTRHVRQYVDIVRQLEQAQRGHGSLSVEALDMAKKLEHDDAARTLRKLCRPLGADHDTCRLLWTLLLTLRVDTTRLTGVRGHRPVR